MPYLENIIESINSNIKEEAFSDKRFAGSKIFGLSEPIIINQSNQNSDRVVPSIISNLGDAEYITPDDKIPVVVYHHINSNIYTTITEESFGNGRWQKNNSDVSMIVMASSAKIKLSASQLETLIMANLIDTISKADLVKYQLKKVFIKIVSSNFNSFAIFANEFKGMKYFLKPEHILFEIKYVIESTFDKRCFKKCECE